MGCVILTYLLTWDDIHPGEALPVSTTTTTLAILRPGDFQRQPLPVPPSEAVDVEAAYPIDDLLQRAESGLQIATSLPAPMRKRHWVDDVTDDFARGTASSMSEPSEPALQEYRGGGRGGEADDAEHRMGRGPAAMTEDTD